MGPHAGMGSRTKRAAIGLSNKEGADAFVRNSFSIKMWSEARLRWITRRGDICASMRVAGEKPECQLWNTYGWGGGMGWGTVASRGRRVEVRLSQNGGPFGGCREKPALTKC